MRCTAKNYKCVIILATVHYFSLNYAMHYSGVMCELKPKTVAVCVFLRYAHNTGMNCTAGN